MTYATACFKDDCRLFLVVSVKRNGKARGLLLMELSTQNIRNKIQLGGLERSDDFAGLIDKEGRIVLGPTDLLQKTIQTTFRTKPSSLQDFQVVTVDTSKNIEREKPTNRLLNTTIETISIVLANAALMMFNRSVIPVYRHMPRYRSKK